MTRWTIEDAIADPCWVKTISPFSNTIVPEDAIQYNTQASAQVDCNLLNNTYPGRFHVGTHPKPH